MTTKIYLSISDLVIAENEGVANDNPMEVELSFDNADFVQVTYEDVRVGPNGDSTGVFYGPDGWWHYGDHLFSDITIWHEETKR